jgi:hypothetical protein
MEQMFHHRNAAKIPKPGIVENLNKTSDFGHGITAAIAPVGHAQTKRSAATNL